MILEVIPDTRAFPVMESIVGAFALALLWLVFKYLVQPLKDTDAARILADERRTTLILSADELRTKAFMSLIDRAHDNMSKLFTECHVVQARTIEALDRNSSVLTAVEISLEENKLIRDKIVGIVTALVPEQKVGGKDGVKSY